MKVLFLMDSLNRGGAEILALDIATNASKYDLEFILTTFKGGELEEDFKATGCEVNFIQRRFPLDLRTILILRKQIILNNISVIHTHQAVDALHAYLATIGTGVKNILSWHGSTTSRKNKLILRLLSTRIDANIAVSEGFKKRIAEEIDIDTKDFQVVYNGVDFGKLTAPTRLLRNELKISDSDQLFGMVGNFYFEARDHYTVCKALPAFFQEIPNAKFVFVGNRSVEKPYLFDKCVEFCKENNILNKVFFLQKRADISNILRSLDVFVFSSFSDTFGIALVEAMIAGVPCICSDIEPLKEVTKEGKYAMLFSAGNEIELVEAMIVMAQNPYLQQKFSEAGQQWALENFSIEKHIDELKRVYQKVCAE